MSRNESATEGPSAVGGELRDAREALGITVADMANALRIRAAHIEALEDGRFSELPGRPYTLGFARSMARYLGLDPDAIGMRLRDEVTGVARPVELVFPESTEDKRLSRAGWIAISLVLVAAAYGAWLALGSNDGEDGTPSEFSASTSVPGALPGIVPPEPGSAATAESEVEDKTPETTVGAAPAMDLAPMPEQAPATSAVTASPALRVVPAPEPPAGAPAKPSAPAATGPVTVPPVAAPRSTPPAASPAPVANVPAASEPDEEDVTPEPSSVAAVPAALPAGRVMLRARQDSWVQIQAADGVTVVARTLRAGESYTVPGQSGLRLTTGNAGALDIIVDGQIAPALGQIGAVRRNVTLDPARLKAGTALE